MENQSLFLTVLPDIVNFVAVLAVLYFATRKLVSNSIAVRSDRVGAQVLEGQKTFNEASKEESFWKSRFEGSQNEIAELKKDAEAMLSKNRANTLEKAKHEAQRIEQEGRLVAQGERNRMIESLTSEFARKSVVTAGKFLESHLGEEDKKGLVKSYSETVGNGASR